MRVRLSTEPDGMGFFYGFAPGDLRRVDVRREKGVWRAYVAGDQIAGAFVNLGSAREAVEKFLEDNPHE